jgi:hypothetical protein
LEFCNVSVPYNWHLLSVVLQYYVNSIALTTLYCSNSKSSSSGSNSSSSLSFEHVFTVQYINYHYYHSYYYSYRIIINTKKWKKIENNFISWRAHDYDIMKILEEISSTSQSNPVINPSPVTAEHPNIVQCRPPISSPIL